MTGQEDVAVKMLKEAYGKAKEDRKLREAYELDMLLVEMLIYKVVLSLIDLDFVNVLVLKWGPFCFLVKRKFLIVFRAIFRRLSSEAVWKKKRYLMLADHSTRYECFTSHYIL